MLLGPQSVGTKEKVDKHKSGDISIMISKLATGCPGYNFNNKIQLEAGIFVVTNSVQIAHVGHIKPQQRRPVVEI